MGLHGRRNRTNLVTRRQMLKPLPFLAQLLILPYYAVQIVAWLITAIIHTIHHARRRRAARRAVDPRLQALSNLIQS